MKKSKDCLISSKLRDEIFDSHWRDYISLHPLVPTGKEQETYRKFAHEIYKIIYNSNDIKILMEEQYNNGWDNNMESRAKNDESTVKGTVNAFKSVIKGMPIPE